jgi:hypothetical protein
MRIILLLTSIAALSACSNEKTTTITGSDGEEIKVTTTGDSSSESGTITFEGKDGEGKITFGDAAAKQGLPLGLPLYPGGEVKGAFMGDDGKSGMGGMATVLTSDDGAKVIGYYKAEAEKRGFKVKSQSTSTSDNGSVANFAAEGDSGETLVVTVTPGEDGKTAAVIMGGEKK